MLFGFPNMVAPFTWVSFLSRRNSIPSRLFLQTSNILLVLLFVRLFIWGSECSVSKKKTLIHMITANYHVMFKNRCNEDMQPLYHQKLRWTGAVLTSFCTGMHRGSYYTIYPERAWRAHPENLCSRQLYSIPFLVMSLLSLSFFPCSLKIFYLRFIT